MKRFLRIILQCTACAAIAVPAVAQAQGFVPLVGIPGVPQGDASIQQYIDALFLLSIGLAAALAVVRIIIAGVKYMLSEIVTSKAEAKKEIGGALLGLVIILAAVTILQTINPGLVSINPLQNATSTTVNVPSRQLSPEERARQQAEECGGTVIRNRNEYEAVCPTGTSGREQFSGWPRAFPSSLPQEHREEIMEECRLIQGYPVTGVVSDGSGRIVISCYRNESV